MLMMQRLILSLREEVVCVLQLKTCFFRVPRVFTLVTFVYPSLAMLISENVADTAKADFGKVLKFEGERRFCNT